MFGMLRFILVMWALWAIGSIIVAPFRVVEILSESRRHQVQDETVERFLANNQATVADPATPIAQRPEVRFYAEHDWTKFVTKIAYYLEKSYKSETFVLRGLYSGKGAILLEVVKDRAIPHGNGTPAFFMSPNRKWVAFVSGGCGYYGHWLPGILWIAPVQKEPVRPQPIAICFWLENRQIWWSRDGSQLIYQGGSDVDLSWESMERLGAMEIRRSINMKSFRFSPWDPESEPFPLLLAPDNWHEPGLNMWNYPDLYLGDF